MSTQTTKNSLSIAQVAALYGVSTQAIFNWRSGTSTRDPMPSFTSETGRPRFKAAEVQKWGKQYGLKPVTTLEAVLTEVKTRKPAVKAAPVKSSSKSAKAKPKH